MTTPTTPATDVKRFTLPAAIYGPVGEVVPASAYDALRARCADFEAMAERGSRACAQMQTERDAATAEVGRLRADAQRYQWLSKNANQMVADDWFSFSFKLPETPNRFVEANSAIDSAMAIAPSPTSFDVSNSDGANSEVK